MTSRANDPVGRRFGLVLSDDEDRRERGCKALVSKGFDVLGSRLDQHQKAMTAASARAEA